MKEKARYHIFAFLAALLLAPLEGLCFEGEEVLILTDENVFRLNVRVADTPEDWQEGARNIEGLKEDEGILFLYPRETIPTFTTKGVSFPLDILLINKEGHVVGIYEEAFGDKYYALPRPIVAALEVSGGYCRRNGISIGARVSPRSISLKPKALQAPRQEEKRRVETQLKENIENHPSDPESYEELAVFYTLTGESEKAAQVFRELLRIEITAPRLNGLGVSLAQLGKWEEAVPYFHQAIEKDPLFAGSYNNLAKYFLYHNKPEKAISLYEEAIKRYPEALHAYLGLLRVHLTTGDSETARSILQKAQRSGLDSPELVRMAGNVALREGDHAGAAQYYLRYLNERPYGKDAAELRAFVLVHSVQPREGTP